MGSVTFSDSYSVTTYGSTSQSVRVNYSESYDVLTNQTTVSITSIEIKSNKTVSGPVVGSVTINGTTVKSLSGGYTNTASPSANSWSTISNSGGGAVAVGHDPDGTGSMTVKLTGGHTNGGITAFGISWNGRVFGVRTAASKTASLTAHPRGSAISSCPSSVATQGTFSLSVSRSSADFYHKATLSVGGTAMYTSDAFAASMSCTIPRSWFSAYPDDSSLTATISVQTYSDESCTSEIGSPVTQDFTVTADAGMKPSVSAGWASIAAYNTGAAAGLLGYIKGYSQAAVTFDGSYVDLTDAVGASVASYSVTCQGETVSESPYRTPVLTQSSLVCTVTDTRGRSASETFGVALMDYARPALSGISVFRCDANGDPDEDGTMFSAKAVLAYSSLNGQNACPLTAAHRAAGGSYGAAAALTSGTASLLGPISADLTYNVKIAATDALGNRTEFFATIPTRKWAMHFRPNGTGVAFGKAAERDRTFEIDAGWDVDVDGDLSAGGDVSFARPLGVASGGTGADTAAGARANLGILPCLKPSSAFAIPASGSSVSYDLEGMTAEHELARWNFSSSAENRPPADLTWTTADGYFTVSNDGGATSETIRPVFVIPTGRAITAH